MLSGIVLLPVCLDFPGQINLIWIPYSQGISKCNASFSLKLNKLNFWHSTVHRNINSLSKRSLDLLSTAADVTTYFWNRYCLSVIDVTILNKYILQPRLVFKPAFLKPSYKGKTTTAIHWKNHNNWGIRLHSDIFIAASKEICLLMIKIFC